MAVMVSVNEHAFLSDSLRISEYQGESMLPSQRASLYVL